MTDTHFFIIQFRHKVKGQLSHIMVQALSFSFFIKIIEQKYIVIVQPICIDKKKVGFVQP